MPDINQMTITDAVKTFVSRPRATSACSFLIDKLIEHLHDFTRETNLTQDEWMYTLNFLYDCGKISSPERHEFILLSDVLGWSALVDMINTKGGGTELCNLGPFYLKDAPAMTLGSHLANGPRGRRHPRQRAGARHARQSASGRGARYVAGRRLGHVSDPGSEAERDGSARPLHDRRQGPLLLHDGDAEVLHGAL